MATAAGAGAAAPSAAAANAAKVLRRGTTVLKFGRMGKPKDKWLVLSKDGQRLQWRANATAPDSSKRDVALKDVTKVHAGEQVTKVFQRFRKKYAGRADTCLSMVCADGLTLDVLFPTEEAFTDWHEALMVVLGQVSQPTIDVTAAASAALDDVVKRLQAALEPGTPYRGDALLALIESEVEAVRATPASV